LLPGLHDGIPKRIKEFVQRNRERIETCAKRLKLPEAIINRAGDNWVPLFAMANAVGGEWLQRVHTAALDYEKHNPTQDRGMAFAEQSQDDYREHFKEFLFVTRALRRSHRARGLAVGRIWIREGIDYARIGEVAEALRHLPKPRKDGGEASSWATQASGL
jgi:hypothetical protein